MGITEEKAVIYFTKKRSPLIAVRVGTRLLPLCPMCCRRTVIDGDESICIDCRKKAEEEAQSWTQKE